MYLNRPTHILERMYSGGWSAVVDASKFFYQFLTWEPDHSFMGVIHPVTGAPLYWASLPMGSANSPACAGRLGLGFLQKLRERLNPGGLTPEENTWRMAFEEGAYDPTRGYRVVLKQEGDLVILLWVHVDDFLIHGPTLETTQRALQVFLDTALEVGLLCHPKKLVPPAQTPKYTGFIFDTRGTPTLRVPQDKRQRALSMVEYTLSLPPPCKVSSLGMAVLAGTLESLADATPSRVGHTYLRSFHSLIHEGDKED